MTKNTPNLPPMNAEEYLGDGIYVSFDGYQLALRNSSLTATTFYLDPLVWVALNLWVNRYPRLLDHMTLQNLT